MGTAFALIVGPAAVEGTGDESPFRAVEVDQPEEVLVFVSGPFVRVDSLAKDVGVTLVALKVGNLSVEEVLADLCPGGILEHLDADHELDIVEGVIPDTFPLLVRVDLIEVVPTLEGRPAREIVRDLKPALVTVLLHSF